MNEWHIANNSCQSCWAGVWSLRADEPPTRSDRCWALPPGAHAAKDCNQGLPCASPFKQNTPTRLILSSSQDSHPDQCLWPSSEQNGLGFAKVGLATFPLKILHLSSFFS